MASSEYKVIHPTEYYRNHLLQKTRPDGRALNEIRPIVLVVNSVTVADSSCTLKQGNCSVICGLRLEIGSPTIEKPNEGYFVPNVELGPMSSMQFKDGPPGTKAQVTSQMIYDIIVKSGCIKLDELCIVPEKHVWVLYCDILCLDYDGSIVDACVSSVTAALSNLKLPKATYDDEIGTLQVDPDVRTQLKLHSNPVATTFMIFGENVVITDPTEEEENLSSGLFVIAVANGKVSYIRKPGGNALASDVLLDCIKVAKSRSKHVNALIMKVMKEQNK